MNLALQEFIAHLSEQPWSNYTKADYTLEQWHAACLIHQHEGSPTSKSECKLPVKTPTGAINKNGVHAAAAALAGARGGVNASPEQKASAKAAIRRLYSQMNEEPPPSMKQSNVEKLLEHYGTKGMRWGVRKPRGDRSAFRARAKAKSEASDKGEERHKERTVYGKAPERLTNAQLEARIKRMDMEKRYNDLNKRDVSAGEKFAVDIATNVGKQVITNIATSTLTALGGHAVKQLIGKKTNLPVSEIFKKK